MTAFDTQKQLRKVDASTFDIVKVQAFHNTRLGTVLSYVWLQILLLCMFAILAADAYTCVNILVFNRWSTSDYHVYEYKVARWIFTGCILFRALLMLYHLAWGIYTYKTKNIALAYLNNVAKTLYSLRKYDYHCLFHEIEHEGFFDRSVFLVYQELDNALEVLVADTPRQVVNILTLRFYATNGDLSNDILANIRSIATTNVRLSVILSFQLASIVLFAFFFFRFCLGMLLYIPVRVKVSHRGYSLLKLYCYDVVNDKVRYLVGKNHKSRRQLLDEGIFDSKEIHENPLLNSESSFDLSTEEIQLQHPFFSKSTPSYRQVSLQTPPPRAYTSGEVSSNTFDNPFRSNEDTIGMNPPFSKDSSLSRNDSSSTYNTNTFVPQNPFVKQSSSESKRRPPPVISQPHVNPFTQKNTSSSSLTYANQPRTRDIFMQQALESPNQDSENPFEDNALPTTTRIGSGDFQEEVEESPLLPQRTHFEDNTDEVQYPSDVMDPDYKQIDRHRSHSISEESDKLDQSAPYPVRGVSMFGSDFDPANLDLDQSEHQHKHF